ncbi:MAG: helix-turn-helix transcriptional regulator [Lachnospiraceae bacterium]|nr:helix-turn-helix transcriptional regulator [Lachnospiraceae bacterium]
MNDNFKQTVLESNKSLYEISAGSGVPYTTINQLFNGKRDINKIAAETASKLALFFDKSIYDILNDIDYIEGIQGNIGHIRYLWGSDEQGTFLEILPPGETPYKQYIEKRSNGKELYKYRALIAKMECEEAKNRSELKKASEKLKAR